MGSTPPLRTLTLGPGDPPPVVPESPIVILLPLIGLATLAGGAYIQRRRPARVGHLT